ncbi:MAG: MFS transporter [Candidatus Heimdallarchaeota archaeon]|nr:MFS transporter [Candidatus Heimdallarchaeota archaeon]
MTDEKDRTLKELLPPAYLLPLLFSYLLEHIALSTYWIFFGIFLSEKVTSSYLNIAVVLAIPAIISILGTTVLSSFSDKTGKRKLLIFIAKVLSMVQYLLLLFFNKSVWSILLILAVFGIFTQIYYTQHSALITIICPQNRKGQVSSYQVFFASAGWMIGSALSDIIYNWKGIIGTLSFAAGFAMLAGILSLFSPSKAKESIIEPLLVPLPEEFLSATTTEEKPAVMESRITTDIKETEKYASYFDIFKRKNVISLLVVLAILDFGFGPFNVITSVYFKTVGLSNMLIAKSNTIATALGMIILLISGSILDRTSRKRVFIFSILAYPIVYTLTFTLSMYPIALFIVYLYPLYALKVPTANTIMADLTKENERGRGMSLIQMEQVFFGNIGAIFGCYIADIFPGTILPKYIPEGIFVIPLFPIFFGLLALLLAFFLIKETNPRYLAKIAKMGGVAQVPK